MFFALRSFRILQIISGLLVVSALILALLAGLGGLGSGMMLAQMTVASPDTLLEASPGTTVLFEGHISPATVRPDNAPDQRLVLWTAKLRLPADEERWLTEDLIKQHFVVDVGDANAPVQVTIANNSYGVAPMPRVINDVDYVVNGMGVGDSVVVVGQLMKGDPTSKQLRLNALQVAAGTRDELVRHVQASDWQFLIVSAGLTMLGTILLLLDRVLHRPVRIKG